MRVLEARARLGSNVSDEVPPTKIARTSASRLVIGLSPRKRAWTSLVRASSPQRPVGTKTISLSLFTFTPTSSRKARSLGVWAVDPDTPNTLP